MLEWQNNTSFKHFIHVHSLFILHLYPLEYSDTSLLSLSRITSCKLSECSKEASSDLKMADKSMSTDPLLSTYQSIQNVWDHVCTYGALVSWIDPESCIFLLVLWSSSIYLSEISEFSRTQINKRWSKVAKIAKNWHYKILKGKHSFLGLQIADIAIVSVTQFFYKDSKRKWLKEVGKISLWWWHLSRRTLHDRKHGKGHSDMSKEVYAYG
jgi:hypothetical protein